MTPSSNPATTNNPKCANCQGARFDDQKSGGQEETKSARGTTTTSLRLALDRSKKNIIDNRWALDDTLPHLPKLGASALAGCVFCGFLAQLLRSQDVTDLFKDVLADYKPADEIALRLFCSYTWGENGFVLLDGPGHRPGPSNGNGAGLRAFQLRAILHGAKSRLYPLPDGYGSFCIINCLVESPLNVSPGDKCAAWLGLRRAPVPLRLSNVELLAEIRTTVQNCVTRIAGHKTCGKPRDPSFLPTRLIEIGDDMHTLRLVHSSDMKKSQVLPSAGLPPYAALSYCWGDMQDASYRLMSKTEATRRAGFKLSELPRGLRDAISIAKALSVSYIWIDALCILQDSISDWERESSQMGDIYGSAHITICSLISSCQYSFLEPERPRVDIPFQSTINPNIQGNYSLSYLDADMDNAGREPYMRDFPKSRWFSRGWTYQELRFSKRLLLLSPSYSAFMCAGLFKVFGGPDVEAPMLPLHSLDHITKDSHRIYDIWLELGQLYSGRILTFPQDALPAISGAAKLFAEKLSDDYLAGVWRSDIRGLLWCYEHLSGTPWQTLHQVLSNFDSPSNYVAPSWSWLGHRYISFYSRPPRLPSTIVPHCQLEISTVVDGQNMFGRVKEGRLTVTGPIYDIGPCTPISIRRGDRGLLVVIATLKGEDFPLFLDWRVESESDAEEPDTLQGNFKLVLIGTYEMVDNGEVQTITIGLVTHKAQKGGNFHRVGRFNLSSFKKGIHDHFAGAKTETITII